ncbi:Tat pathway signal sequence domain protein [Kitasatospora sp. NPDC004614]|uniref:Tat pathway signal sequence domain protein n=1 Tax=unclassified Kitasatospora TaxID=2633591 RepID=UPI0036BD612A
MRNRLFAAALAATTALIALPAGSADAAPKTAARHTNSPAVTAGTPLSADLVSGSVATLYWPGTTTGFRCTVSHLSSTVAADPNAPGVLSGPVNVLTFSGCTSNVVGVTGVNSLTMDYLPYTLAFYNAPGNPVALYPNSAGIIQTTIVFKTLAGTATCVLRANSLNGNHTGNPSRIDLVQQPFTKYSGPSICSSSLELTAAYGPIVYGVATALVN